MDRYQVAIFAAMYTIVQPTLIGLKLGGYITWDWWIVLLPTIIVVLYICFCLIRPKRK